MCVCVYPSIRHSMKEVRRCPPGSVSRPATILLGRHRQPRTCCQLSQTVLRHRGHEETDYNRSSSLFFGESMSLGNIKGSSLIYSCLPGVRINSTGHLLYLLTSENAKCSSNGLQTTNPTNLTFFRQTNRDNHGLPHSYSHGS